MNCTAHEQLGYNPRSDVTHWQGTPIPPVHHPLELTPRRQEIAGKVWWNGPAWTILRNASWFLWQVMDYGSDDDIRYTLQDVSERTWIGALKEARPGLLSRGSYVLWSLAFRQIGIDECCDWPDTAHRLDQRPLRNQTHEQMYRRHRREGNSSKSLPLTNPLSP